MRKVSVLMLVLFIAALVSGCGSKGTNYDSYNRAHEQNKKAHQELEQNTGGRK